MGIKFYCPNGHKLNVKAFLAGKRAICPKCGVKVVVPADVAGGQSEESFPGAAELEVLDTAQAASMPGKHSYAADSSLEAGDGNQASNPLSPAAVDAVVAGTAAGPSTNAAAYAAATPTANGPAAADPIDEAPTAVWYVRPPSGGQFGPASGETMRAWLNEGRVTGNTLVWRGGWPDWRAASAAFPKLSPAGAPAAVVPPVAPAIAPVAAPATAPAAHTAGMAAAAGGFAPVASVVAVPAATPVAAAPYAVTPAAAVPTPARVLPVGRLPVGQLPIGSVALPDVPLESLVGEHYEGAALRSRRRRRKSQDVTRLATGILVALVIILGIILAAVFVKNQSPPPKSSSALSSEQPIAVGLRVQTV